MTKQRVMVCATFFLALASGHLAGAELEFQGEPESKVTITEGATTSTPVSPKDRQQFRVVIIQDRGNYYWVSRDNVPLIKIEPPGGAYITYISASGYIRVLSPAMRQMRLGLATAEREKQFVYMEHLIHQFGSITYFGK